MGKFNVNMMKLQGLMLILCMIFFTSCSNDQKEKSGKNISTENRPENKFYSGKGIGPIQKLNISQETDDAMAKSGEVLFNSKCSSCHKLNSEKGIGPGLAGVTSRRTPEWIMNMMLNPMEMTQKDSLAKELLAIYYSQMLDNNLTEAEARSLLEFLRTK